MMRWVGSRTNPDYRGTPSGGQTIATPVRDMTVWKENKDWRIIDLRADETEVQVSANA